MRPSPSETAAAVRAPLSCNFLCDGWRGRQAPRLQADGPSTWGTAVPLAAPLTRGRAGAARHWPAICSASHTTTDASRWPTVPLILPASLCLVLAACGVAFGGASRAEGPWWALASFIGSEQGACGGTRRLLWGGGQSGGLDVPWKEAANEVGLLAPETLHITSAQPPARPRWDVEPARARGSATTTRLHVSFHRRRALSR